MDDKTFNKKVTRRDFIRVSSTALFLAVSAEPVLSLLKPAVGIDNPLDYYPDRDWEKIYRDMYSYDSTFTFLCAPNDTHNCLLKAYVKNGVILYLGPTFGYGKAKDIYGNQASHRWDPRCCQKGLVMFRRIYGPRRVKYPSVRKGFKEWADKGFPRDKDGRVPKEFLNRGREPFVKVSFEEAYSLAAKAMVNISTTYSGKKGEERLKKQGYDEAMVEATHEAGTQTLKFRGGMPLLGATRIFGLARFANSMALLDNYIRKVGKDKAVGARGWDSYSWHTDLPPGHTMVTGHQTIDFDLAAAENAKMIICWGMNWISTKMPDGHWLTEARLSGTKVVTVACEYQSTSNKADEVIIIRPGSDTAFALAMANVIIKEGLYDEEYVKSSTDLPFLVRLDNLKLLHPQDFIRDYKQKELENLDLLDEGKTPPPSLKQVKQITTRKLREEWGDFAVWSPDTGAPGVITRDEAGQDGNFALEGEYEVQLVDGKKIKVKPVFQLLKEYSSEFTPEVTSKICHVHPSAIINLARDIARNKEKTLVPVGMGPNHFFNNDLKDRAIFFVCALTKNIGYHGGNIGSYAGNYRGAYFNGLPRYLVEDPFDIEVDKTKPPKIKKYYKMESAHYYNYGDRPLRVGNKLFTGKTHMPTPTKFMWFANGNSILGNIKWHYDVVLNTLPKIDAIVVNEWWWTASCEYADVVFPVDSWAEFKYPDFTAAVTNPFLQIYPKTPLKRVNDSRGDIEVLAGVGKALADVTGLNNFKDYWRFVHENNVEVYLQRIIDGSTALKGYRIEKLEEDAEKGIPALLMTRTYPKIMGWEQSNENKPHYTKTGRLEFYRDEDEFIEYGENIPVHREPVDATFYEPNVIVCGTPGIIRPKQPEGYGIDRNDLSTEVRQVRNVVVSPIDLVKTSHPRRKDGWTHIYITPKYRHGAHTTPVDTDLMAIWFGPFGDPHRYDKRMPWVGEGYVDINPADAKALGIEDGDYVHIDGDPEDRPYRGWKEGTEEYKVARCMMRARYYRGLPRGIARSWFHMYVATFGSVKAHETNPDKLARNPLTNYQAMFRYGSHQSATRAWLRPTLMTDSLGKDYFGQVIGKGFEADVHCTVGAPKESFIKLSKAENGGIDHPLWRPAALGFRAGYENEAMKKYLKGEYV
ncbi:MAG: molybdopterin-dependent oxidoreductase [Candidatus Omnitrophica bacterium]|nr:molybdopterin-dependent oxidoreductase [Candidatus Omnitrophota bacterium]